MNGDLITGNKFESVIPKSNFHMSFPKLMKHRDSLYKKGFIFGIHNDCLAKLNDLCKNNMYMYIDGIGGEHIIKDICSICEFYMPSNKKFLQQVNITGVYNLHNIKTNKYITIDNPSPKNIYGVKVNNAPMPFYIYSRSNRYPGRHSIRYEPMLKNQNGSDGWHLYTSPNDSIVYGAGNDGEWATFTIEKRGNDYLLKSLHLNSDRTERYLYIDSNNNLKSDGTSDMDGCTWNLLPSQPVKKETINDGVYKVYNIKSKRYIFAKDPTPTSNRCIIAHDIPSPLFLHNNNNKIYIKLDNDMKNQNGSDGWHLYTRPNDIKLYGAGNVSVWSSFTIEPKDKYYLIKGYYNEKDANAQKNTYFYMDQNNNIKTDGNPNMEECLWSLLK